jgi:hypothetical protein
MPQAQPSYKSLPLKYKQIYYGNVTVYKEDGWRNYKIINQNISVISKFQKYLQILEHIGPEEQIGLLGVAQNYIECILTVSEDEDADDDG